MAKYLIEAKCKADGVKGVMRDAAPVAQRLSPARFRR